MVLCAKRLYGSAMITLMRCCLAFAVVGIVMVWGFPAKADLRLCNLTNSRVGIAMGHRDAQGWQTEGWWNLKSRGCETLIKGQLSSRFYYIHAVDYDRGGEWSGASFMCTREREFTIRGVEDCLARGYDRSGFFEVDTGEQKSWTIQLGEPSAASANALKPADIQKKTP
jgi:uncharacterized membrane protein